MEISLEKQLMC